jgi:hypothetical protein
MATLVSYKKSHAEKNVRTRAELNKMPLFAMQIDSDR